MITVTNIEHSTTTMPTMIKLMFGVVGVHYKPQARFSEDCDVQRRNPRIFLKGEAPSLLF